MKQKVAILLILLIVSLTFAACSTITSANQATADSDSSKPISIPEFFNDLGKTLNTLKKEHPRDEILIQNDGLPDSATASFGGSEGKYAYFFFDGQDTNFEDVMGKYGNQLKCSGFITTADVLSPEMEDDMTFSDFLSLIGVSDYEYGSKEGSIQGWLNFKYNNMVVWINTNEATTHGGWEFTAIERVKKSAPVVIYDEEIYHQNYNLANTASPSEQ
ncbi:hypothetical protein [Aminipila terrae]|uniref:Lipoprotein n=1 Tax=Aminipila terrae TaxID=2697030 RepID=A0A6P1MI94_9FIRM|nr:hypothetical protein [Aminipila terrae]QHI73461.1 hypothetical protein Ami3637_14710 [Aminipila terrae]